MSNSPCCRWPPSTRCAEKKREKKMHEKKSRFNSKGLGINSISGRHRPSSTHPPARQKVAVYFPFFFFSFASSQLFLRDLSTTGKSIQTGLSFRNRSAKKSQRVLLNQSTAARKKKKQKKGPRLHGAAAALRHRTVMNRSAAAPSIGAAARGDVGVATPAGRWWWWWWRWGVGGAGGGADIRISGRGRWIAIKTHTREEMKKNNNSITVQSIRLFLHWRGWGWGVLLCGRSRLRTIVAA